MSVCRRVRERLTVCGASVSRELREHLEACAACARYAERLESARRYFEDHHFRVEPDAAFAGRVAARLPGERVELLGWAARRLLPASIALVIVLAWFAWQTTAAPGELVTEAPTDDVLSWVIAEANGNGS